MPAQLALAALAELSPLVSERVDASGYQLVPSRFTPLILPCKAGTILGKARAIKFRVS